jgi:GINS complex subunit 2
LLLKRQKRANISPPPWLSVDALTSILEFEMDDRTAGVFAPAPDLPPPQGVSLPEEPYLSRDMLEMSSPFLKDAATSRAQADALPYHWLELSHLLLTHAADDFDDPDTVRRLVRDLREVRMSKLRKGFKVLDAGAGVKMNGVGGMEVAEVRGFVGGVVDGLRKINRSREEARRERDAEKRENGFDGSSYQDDDDGMQL